MPDYSADLTGQRFGVLTVLRRTQTTKGVGPSGRWDCRCDCGNEKTSSGERLLRGLTFRCTCVKTAYRRAWREANKERDRANQKDWQRRNKEGIREKERAWAREHYHADKDKHRGIMRKYKYGITPEEFQELLTKQGGVCAICKQAFKAREPHVDHSHATEKSAGFYVLCVTRL